MQSIAKVMAEVGVALDHGLTPEQIETSRIAHGRNTLSPPPRPSLWWLFFSKFNDPIIRILLLAAALSIGVAVAKADWGHLIEAIAICVAVVLATGVSFISEYRSRREFELLSEQKEAAHVRVRRNGVIQEISIDEVVVGDVVLVEAGHEIPADGRIVRTVELRIDQSLMNGESVPAEKEPGDPNREGGSSHDADTAYRGTHVVEGNGEILITEVGDATELGKLAKLLTGAESDDQPDENETVTRIRRREVRHRFDVNRAETPLQTKLRHLAELISKVGYAAAALVFVSLAIRGFATGELTGFDLDSAMAVLSYFMITVVVIVVAVPEGLPMSVTISLALAMRKMTRANALVRQMMATETVGSTTVICSDKTGTLTENRMRVKTIIPAGASDWQSPDGMDALEKAAWMGESVPVPRRPIEHMALNVAVNSTAHLNFNNGDKPGAIGNPTEGAMLRWLWEHGIDYRPLRERADAVFQMLFSSDRKRMSSVLAPWGGMSAPVVYTKGASEIVIGLCDSIATADGGKKPLTPADHEMLTAALKHAAAEAMRVLCFAHRELPADWPRDHNGLKARRDEIETGLVLDGLVAIADPVRTDVPPALERCRAAGIEVKMITGDNIETARAIGREVGLFDREDALALTSEEFRARSDESLKPDLHRLRVLARATPQDKFRMVSMLQDNGHVVAVTGDGTNDAPALKRADAGLSMGSGTEVAKEASDIVLLDDSFATIERAVSWGRTLYENIQRFLQFQLTINLAALGIAFVGPFLEPITGLKTPLTAIQLLWVNVIMDSLAAIALCSEPPRAGVMQRKPRRRDESIITRAMVGTMFTTGIFYIAVILGMLLWLPQFLGVETANVHASSIPTIIFTTFVMFQVWNLFNCRSLDPHESAFTALTANPIILAIAAGIVVTQLVIVNAGGALGEAFHTQPLDWQTWLWIAGLTASVLVLNEAMRFVRRLVAPKHAPAQTQG